jgi:hypothetical protein
MGLGTSTSPGWQRGSEQRVEGLASGRASLMLDLDQVGHVICRAGGAGMEGWGDVRAKGSMSPLPEVLGQDPHACPAVPSKLPQVCRS